MALWGWAMWLSASAIPDADPQPPRSTSRQNLADIKAILAQPDNQLDLIRVKLKIDQMIDPSVDIEKTVKQIDGMATKVKQMLPPNATAQTKMLALRQFLYLPGQWNNNNPFHYDFDDKLGQSLQGALLSHYLATQKGQCVSMPLLYIALAERLGMDVALAEAPNHLFVMLKDESGAWLNLETTADGAPTSLASYQRQTPMTQTALSQGAYMRPLRKREAVAALAELLVRAYMDDGQPEDAISLANLALPYHPTDIALYLYASKAFQAMVQRDFVSAYPTSADIPFNQKARFDGLAGRAFALQQKAIALGYQPPGSAVQGAYMEKVNQAKTNFVKKDHNQ